MRSDNTSGYVGVQLYTRTGRWTANIEVKGKRIYLGYFDTIEEAVEARKAAEKTYREAA